MKQILIIEDDEKLNNGIKLALQRDYSCTQAFSIADAKKLFLAGQFDLVLLDVSFPDGNGMDYLVWLRGKSMVTVILLTAASMEMDIVSGLELGANDYITKPFSLMVLRARAGVQLRDKEASSVVFRDGDFCFDFQKMEFSCAGRQLDLSPTERKLLRCLTRNKGKHVSRSCLIDETWPGEAEYVEEHALTVAISRLRKKLQDADGGTAHIKTVYGTGYIW